MVEIVSDLHRICGEAVDIGGKPRVGSSVFTDQPRRKPFGKYHNDVGRLVRCVGRPGELRRSSIGTAAQKRILQ